MRREGYLRLTRHVALGEIGVELERLPLSAVEDAWARQREATGGPKLVLLPGAA